MKTTIDIADELIKRAKLIQKREETTLRALVEEGLRYILEKRSKPAKKYKYRPIVVGKPYKPGMPVPDLRQILIEANERPWVGRELGKLRVAQQEAAYGPVRKKASRKKQ